MGLSTTASHLIWAVALIATVGTALGAFFDHQEDLVDAREDRRDIDAERLHAHLGGSFCHTGSVMIVDAVNEGTVPLNATKLTFTLDGQPATGFEIDNVEHPGSHAWLPDERVYLNKSVPTAPDHLVIFTERGAAFNVTKLTCRVLTTITLTPSSSNLAIGESADFTAAGFDQYGAPYAMDALTWATAAGTVAALDATSARLTAGTTAGTTFTITATSGSVVGTSNVTVRPDAPVSVTVSPDPVDVAAGGTQAFTAAVLDQYGNQNDSATLAWTTTAGTITDEGILTAQTTAQSGLDVTATVNALSDAATVDVVAGAVSRIDVTPSTTALLAGSAQSFSAAAFDAYDNAIGGATFAWSATRGAIDETGAYTAPSTVGADTVTATYDGVDGQAAVTVTADVHVDALATYKAGVASTAFVRGETIEVRVTVRDHNGNLVDGVTATVELLRANGQVDTTLSGASDASGVAAMSYTLPSNAQPGSWTARVTGLSGANFTYDSASNVVTQVTFTVSTS